MSKDWISRPHIEIPPESIRHSKKKTRQPPRRTGIKKDPKEFGKTLIQQLEESVKYCSRPEKIIPDEGTLFIIRTEGAISFEEDVLERFGLRFSLQIDEYSAVVTVASQFLDKFREALSRYMETSVMHSYIDKIESISLIKLNRVSPELSDWISSSDLSLGVEIEMLPNLGEEFYTSLVRKLETFLKTQGVEALESRIRDKSASIRANLRPQTAKMIVQGADSVWQTRQVPRIVIGKPQSLKVTEQPTPKAPDYNARSICVLDTGVDLKQPFLKGVVLDALDLTPDNSPQDVHGHGTFVAGLAAYGVLENRANPEATARIISAKVLGVNPPRYPYLETLLEEAARRFHEHAKIFSLSIMYEQCCQISRPSDLAYTIDRLSHDYNVLFVICTGNIRDDLQSLVSSVPYPTYMGDDSCIIYGGAEACMAVTVGGVAHKDSDRSIAKKGEPSPFTRRGELNERGKPDVVSWAGNLEQMPGSGTIKGNNVQLGITSLGLSPDTLAYDIGTSYSAPIVANVFARLSKECPHADCNLLKALVVHFAQWPDEHYRLNASDGLKKALYGKGVPEFDRSAFSTSSCATYIVEDSIGYDEIASVPIYVPKVMRDIYGEKRLRVTLVYDPPVDRGVQGYSLLDLDFQLFKQFNIQRNWDRLYRRQWDNVKTDVFRWQKGGWGKEWSLMIYPKLRFRRKIPNFEMGYQKFALVVSLEDPSKRLNIYDAIINERKVKIETLEAFVQSRRK